jgi:hypothetical protein
MVRRGWRSLAALALAPALAAGACSDDDDDGGGGGGGGASVEALVGRVPARAGFGDAVVYGSLERIRAAGDVDPAATVEDELRQLVDLAGASLVMADPVGTQALQPELRDELGFDVTMLDATVQAGVPPDTLAVFAGAFDEDEVDRALTTYEPWAGVVEVGDEDGVATYRFGDEFDIDIELRTTARAFGESVRVAVDDGTVAWAKSDDTFDAVIAAIGGGPSLLDEAGVRDVARALDDATAHVAVITATPDQLRVDPVDLLGADPSEAVAAEVEQRLADAPVLEPWDVAALAETFGDDGPELLLVAWYPDADAGETAAEQLTTILVEGTSLLDGEPWADRCPDPEVEAADGLVTARCPIEGSGVALDLFFRRDTPLRWLR